MKLVAANYMPAISVMLSNKQQPQTAGRRSIATIQREDDATPLLAGKTYPFQLSLTNPLYDPIQVRLAVQRHQAPASGNVFLDEGTTDPGEANKLLPRRPPFAISLPSSAFSVAAFAEAWEYEDDEEMFGVEGGEDEMQARNASPSKRGSKSKTVGVLEKKANTTIVGGEVVIGRDGRGDVKVRYRVII